MSKYSKECIKMYCNATLTPGILNLLNNYNLNYYVASGSDEEELNMVFKNRSMDQYFKKIYGSPRTKHQSVSKILSDCDNKKDRVVLIGDSVSDLNASLNHSIDFIFMQQYSENKKDILELSKAYNFATINTLEDLMQY